MNGATTGDTTPAIDFRSVRFSYDGQREALAGVTLPVEPGSFVCVLGGNGSGKSTLAKHINALLTPDSGSVLVLGRDTADPGSTYFVRSHAGMVFQNPDDQIVASVIEDDVAFGPENLGVPSGELRRRVEAALARVGLQGFGKRQTESLSGGQKQRVAIAGALAMNPDILVLDEAGAMLDPRGRAGLLRVCRELNEEGLTIVLITHFMDEAALADRVIVLDGGVIALDGAPGEVLLEAARLSELALDVPFATRLSMALRDRGVPVALHADTNALERELVKAIAPPSPPDSEASAATSGSGPTGCHEVPSNPPLKRKVEESTKRAFAHDAGESPGWAPAAPEGPIGGTSKQDHGAKETPAGPDRGASAGEAPAELDHGASAGGTSAGLDRVGGAGTTPIGPDYGTSVRAMSVGSDYGTSARAMSVGSDRDASAEDAPAKPDRGTGARAMSAGPDRGASAGEAPARPDRGGGAGAMSAGPDRGFAGEAAPAIELEGVSFTYEPASRRGRKQERRAGKQADWGRSPDDRWALSDVSFAVREGEILGVAGHTGSGKSTLIQLACGMLRPTSGAVRVRGQALEGKRASAAHLGVGIVFQYPERQLFAATVFDDVAFGPRNLGRAPGEVEAAVRDALAMVHLELDELRDRSPFSLSGGQQRRIALAGVLAMRPQVLVLDEPTAGLDPLSKRRLLDLLRELHGAGGLTVVVVSHDMDDLASLCDRIVVLNEGRIFASGTPGEVFAEEQRLKSVGLGMPRAVHFANQLAKAGIELDIPAVPTAEELAQAIAAGRFGS